MRRHNAERSVTVGRDRDRRPGLLYAAGRRPRSFVMREPAGERRHVTAQQPVDDPGTLIEASDPLTWRHVEHAGSNPLPKLAAFQQFGRDSDARVDTTPVPTPATVIGHYYAAAQLPGTP